MLDEEMTVIYRTQRDQRELIFVNWLIGSFIFAISLTASSAEALDCSVLDRSNEFAALLDKDMVAAGELIRRCKGSNRKSTKEPSTGSKEDEWYKTTRYKSDFASEQACDLIKSKYAKSLSYSFMLQGDISRGRLYVTLSRGEANDIGDPKVGARRVPTRHTLTPAEGAELREAFNDRDRHIPFIFELAASLPKVPSHIGVAMTLWEVVAAMFPSNKVAPAAIAEIIQFGGDLVRVDSITSDENGHPWIGKDIVLETSIASKPKTYVLCSALFPLHIE